MSIKQEAIKNILDFFNRAIDAYNIALPLIEQDNASTALDRFDITIPYYTAMETAFKEVLLDISPRCGADRLEFHELIENMIDTLIPRPLQSKIDLFYILRYRDTRNQIVHNLKIQDINPFPRLFQNAKLFILTYIDSQANIKEWKIHRQKFDFAGFTQEFNYSAQYDRIRILVIGPMHDYSREKLALLTRYHFNIILDFDPYSNEGGFRAAVDISKTQFIHLNDFKANTGLNVSLDYATWVLCDGDHSAGVHSFQKRTGTPKFFPCMLSGPNSWDKCFNTDVNPKRADSQLRSFIHAYFNKMLYNIDLLFLMDYSEPIVNAVYTAVDQQLAGNADVKVFFIDDAHNKALMHKAENDYDNWLVYPANIYDFMDAIGNNIKPEETENERYCIVHDSDEGDGEIPLPTYHYINRNFFLLHEDFPAVGDEPDYAQEEHVGLINRFLRGEEIKWNLIRYNDFAQFQIFESVFNNVRNCAKNKHKEFHIYHTPGFGGTTIAKYVAFKLSKEFPVLFMKSYNKETLRDTIQQVYEYSHKSPVCLFIEDTLFTSKTADKDECMNIIASTTIPYMVVLVSRGTAYKNNIKNRVFINQYLPDDIDALIHFNKKAFSYQNLKTPNQMLSYNANDFIRSLDIDNCSPFIINLSIYQKEFIKLDSYIQPYVERIEQKPVLVKFFRYLCVFSKFIGGGLAIKFAENLLGVSNIYKQEGELTSTIASFLDMYDAILYKRYNADFQIFELSIRSPQIAEALLQKLLCASDNIVGYRAGLQETLISLIHDLSAHLPGIEYTAKKLRKLFIEKSSEEVEEAEELSETHREMELMKKYFAPVFGELWDANDPEIAGDVFNVLIEEYSDEVFFYAHAARFYAYTSTNFDQAQSYLKVAEQLLDDHPSVASEIYHVKGMCLSKKYYMMSDDFERLTHVDENIFDELFRVVDEAIGAFEKSRMHAYTNDIKSAEYACTAWLKILMHIIKQAENHNLLSSEKVQMYLQETDNLVYDLEEIYAEQGKEEEYNSLMRKKATLNVYKSDFGSAMQRWNNFFNESKKNNVYENCICACKNRYYILETETNFFKDINKKNQERIYKLSEDYLHCISNISPVKLRFNDLSVYISIARLSKVRIAAVSSIVNNLYIVGSGKYDVKVLFYRYVLKFLSAYHNGDQTNLKEAVEYKTDCSIAAKGFFNRTNIIEFFSNGNEMDSLVSYRHLLKIHYDRRSTLYSLDEMGTLRGILKYRKNETSLITPFDQKGHLMIGIEIFVNLKNNSHINDTYNGLPVTFKMGFALDGLRAESMSVRPEDKPKTEAVKNMGEVSLLVGETVSFVYKLSWYNEKKNIIAIVGSVGENEDCILHIKRIGEMTHNRISAAQMQEFEKYCIASHNVDVYLQEQINGRWQAIPDKTVTEVRRIFNL